MTTANSDAASSMQIMRLTSDAFAALQALAVTSNVPGLTPMLTAYRTRLTALLRYV